MIGENRSPLTLRSAVRGHNSNQLPKEGSWGWTREGLGDGKVAVAERDRRLGGRRIGDAAFQQLPPGDQVNNDVAAGINPNLPVNVSPDADPANADVVGGSLVATKPAVPWAIFRQTRDHRHIAARRPDLQPLVRGLAPGRRAATARSAALERESDVLAAR